MRQQDRDTNGIRNIRGLFRALPPERRFLLLLALCWMLVFGCLLLREVGKFDQMQKPLTRMQTEHFNTRDGGVTYSSSYSGGFVPGATSLAYAASFALGLGLFLAAAGTGPQVWRGVSTLVALVWYAFGLCVYLWYRRIAPAPEIWPLGVVAAYGAGGLLPVGFALRSEGADARRRAVVIWSGVGAHCGAVAGATLGSAVYAVARSLDFSSSDTGYDFAVRLSWWPFGLGIGAAAGALLAAALASRRLRPPKPEVRREEPTPGPTSATTANKPVAVVVGCVFALVGLVILLLALSQFGEMQLPLSSGTSHSGGFMPGVGAFFGMLFFGVGVGVGSLGAAPSPAAGRVIALILALLWHGVGLGSCWCYCSLAPKPDQWPFAVLVVVFEWLGLIPLGLAVPHTTLAGRLRSAVWHLMGGAFLGAAAGLLIGGVAGGVQMLLSSRHGSGTAGGDWWLYGFAGGATVIGIGFVVLRLLGWKVPTSDFSPSAPCAVCPTVCRKCHHQMGPGLAECPYCHAPVRARDLSTTGNSLKGVGLVCILFSFAASHAQDWLRSQGIGPEAAGYLFWLLFIGGWIIVGIGGLLSGGKPVSPVGGSSDSAEGPFPRDDTDTGPPPADDLPAEVVEALRRGEKLEAVRLYCEATGVGLQEAMRRLEEAESRPGL